MTKSTSKPAAKAKGSTKAKPVTQTATSKAKAAKAPAKAPAKTPAKAKAPKPTAKKAAPASDAAALVRLALGPNRIAWTVNPKVYPIDVVSQAAFVFIDRAYLMLDQDGDGNTVVVLKGKKSLEKDALEALQGEFANELLNQTVRRTLSRQNRRIRELIVAKALFAAGRPQELGEIMAAVGGSGAPSDTAARPWDGATQEEQDELDRLLAEIEQDFADDPMGIAVPWDEKYGESKKEPGPDDNSSSSH